MVASCCATPGDVCYRKDASSYGECRKEGDIPASWQSSEAYMESGTGTKHPVPLVTHVITLPMNMANRRLLEAAVGERTPLAHGAYLAAVIGVGVAVAALARVSRQRQGTRADDEPGV